MSRFANTNAFYATSQLRLFANFLLSMKIFATVSLLIISLSSTTGCNEEKSEIDQITDDRSTNNIPNNNPAITDARVRAEIDHFCGDCHATPPPTAIPREGWFAEVELGFKLYEESGRTDLTLPRRSEVIDYYRRLAPVSIASPPLATENDPSPIEFKPTHHAMAAINPNQPHPVPSGTANVHWYDQANTPLLDRSTLMLCDMRVGIVQAAHFEGQSLIFDRRALVPNPSNTTLTDLDNDGVADYLVADLGSFLPEDHTNGQVIWLRESRDFSDKFETTVLMDGLGRVTDVQAGDFNQDGQQDLLVAEFGWRLSGHVWILLHTGIENGIPQYKKQIIDDRHGVIHIPTADFNGDGHLDFVSLISQEHESIELFLNRGDGTFRRQKIFSADNPVWGSTGIDLHDLDHDGDLDILFTNGDVFDSFYIVPYQGVHWIENQGDGVWNAHVLRAMPGIHRAVAADFDNDGDDDIVCCSLISSEILETGNEQSRDSLIWLEQTKTGQFTARSLELDNALHTTVTVGDFDGDGDIDIATGQFADKFVTPRTDVSIWWNNSINQP
jgi:hypothetical protein